MLIGKAITGGYMTFSAVATTHRVADMISSSQSGVMMHGPTFMGNPLACAIAVASVKLLLSSPWQKRIAEIEAIMRRELAKAADRDYVEEIRVLGGIGVLQIKEPVDLGRFQQLCVEQGVWIRPFGKNAYIMPPYLAVSDEQVVTLCRALIDILDQMHEQ